MVDENPTSETPVEGNQGNETPESYTKSQLEELARDLKEEWEVEKQEEFKGIQRVVTQKDQIIKGLQSQGQPQATSAPSQASTMMLELLKQQAGESGDPAAMGRIQQIELAMRHEAANFAKQSQQKRIQEEDANARAELEQKIAVAGLDPKDSMFRPVWSEYKIARLADGDWSEARAALDEIMSKATKKGAEPNKEKEVETEAQIRERLEKEYRDKLETAGLLQPEKVTPTGTGNKTLGALMKKDTKVMSQELLREYKSALLQAARQ